MKKITKRSDCPISRALDILGDKWTLLILRDMAFRGFRFYKEFLGSFEGVATNVLSDRLKMLEELDFVTSRKFEENKTQKEYLLSERGILTVPIILEMLAWGHDFDPDTGVEPEFYKRYLADKVGVANEVMAALRSGAHRNFC